MVRKQVYLYQEQDALLKRRAGEAGVTEAELIREALEVELRYRAVSRPSLVKWDEERKFIQSLIEAGPVSGGRTWKREDLHER